jgi:hypothetical protein
MVGGDAILWLVAAHNGAHPDYPRNISANVSKLT